MTVSTQTPRNSGRGRVYDVMRRAFIRHYPAGVRGEYLDIPRIARDIDFSASALHVAIRNERLTTNVARALMDLEAEMSGENVVMTDECILELVMPAA